LLLRLIWQERAKVRRRLGSVLRRARRHGLRRRARPVVRWAKRRLPRLASDRIRRRVGTRTMGRFVARAVCPASVSTAAGRLKPGLKRLLVGAIRRSIRLRPLRQVARRAVLPAMTSGVATLQRGLADGEDRPARASRTTERRRNGVGDAGGGLVRALHEHGPVVDASNLSARTLRDLLRSTRKRETPIIAGPWVGEVGFEVLYWMPLLRWIAEREPWIKERLVVLSRGGSGHWYRGLSSRYVDIFDYLEPGELWETRQRNAPLARSGRPKDKQFEMAAWERDLVDRVRQHLGFDEVDVLHPSVMFLALRHLQREEAIPRVRAMSSYPRLEPPELGPLAGLLPDDFVAAKFYFSAAFPETEANRAFIGSLLRTLTQTTRVVLLNTGMLFDDHWDFEAAVSERLLRVDHLMTPTNNLHLQTIAISRARSFVGTYGGLSYLPPFLGVPSLSFYSRPDQFAQHHLDLAQRVFRGPEWATYLALHTDHLDLVRSLTDGRLAAPR